MKPKQAEEKYWEILRKMSGSQRVKIGCQLYEMSLKIARSGIRHQFPGISEDELKNKLRQRLSK